MRARRRRRLPRTRSVFTDLALLMLALGLTAGVVFPPFVRLLGVPAHLAFAPRFVASCLVAGLCVGGGSFLLARLSVGRPLRTLSTRLRAVVDLVARSDVSWTAGLPDIERIPVDREDDLAATASAFNDLLDAIAAAERFRALIHHSSDIVLLADAEGVVLAASPAVTRVLGFDADAAVGAALLDYVHPDDRPAMDGALARHEEPVHVEARVQRADGGWSWQHVAVSDLLDDPAVAGFALTCRDITERRALEEELAHQASHDSLTGLPNRALLQDRLRAALQTRRRADADVAVLFIDLDDFKAVNDGLGHTAGDEVLRAVAARVAEVVRPGDIAARLGGDELAVLVSPVADPTEAEGVASRVLEAVSAPLPVAGRVLRIAASIGLAARGDRDVTPDDLLREADVAMYEAKRAGKGTVATYGAARHRTAV